MIKIKNQEEIDGIRKSCKLAFETLIHIEEYVKEGVTTEKLNEIADTFIRDNKAIPATLNYKGFPKCICTSINEVICHGIPKNEDVLKDGDIINIDVTTILNGYYGDTSKMFLVGNVCDKAKDLVKVTKECLDLSIKEVKPGNQFYKIAKRISSHAMNNGYSVVYQFCGHGTGLEFHEEPLIQHYYNIETLDKRVMREGMIFTIEPMICEKRPHAVILNDGWTAVTKDNGLSAQYEHTILVTKSGCEILTQ